MQLSKKWIWYKDLVYVLVQKDISVRYKGSVLGVLWAALQPLSQAFVYFLVFGIYMRFNVPHYLVTLLAALFPWQWVVTCINGGVSVFVSNPSLIKKVAFPRQALPLVMVLYSMVHFFVTLPIYVLFLLHDGLYPSWMWFWGIPLMCVITVMTVYGIVLFLGTLNLFFKDIQNLTTVFVQLAFFAAPIMYTMGQVAEQYVWCFRLNPVAPLMICWRSVLFDNALNTAFLPYAFGYALVFLLVGYCTFHKLQQRFAEVM